MEWLASYNDGTELKQFVNGEERMFKDIDQDKLISFTLSNANNEVVVCLSDGKIVINGVELYVAGMNNTDFENRLIYFRRVTLNIGTGNIDENKSVKSFVGYQFTDDKDKNNKIIIECGNDNFVVHVN